MLFSKLKNYNFEEVITLEYEKEWLKTIKDTSMLRFHVVYDIYRCFIDVTIEELDKPFSTNKIVNINNHFRALIGFLYTEFNAQYETKYKYAKIFKSLFSNIFKSKFNLSDLKFSATTESSQVNECIKNYKTYKKNEEKINYYRGWFSKTSDNKEIYLNLSNIYNKYGSDYTSLVYQTLKSLAERRIKTTANVAIIYSLQLFNYIIELFPTLKELKFNFQAENSYNSMLKIYNLRLIDTKIKNESIKLFHEKWRSTVSFFYEMVDLGLFEKPFDQIITPLFKSSKNLDPPHVKITNNNKLISTKLITKIPLSYTDSKAKELIFQKIINDIDYIVACSENKSKKTMLMFENFMEKAKNGKVKYSSEKIFESNKQSYTTVAMGPNNIENVCATYKKFPFIHPEVKVYASYLGFSKQTKALEKIIPAANCEYLYSFLILLINEHPCITPSSLISWKLYTNGKNTGLYKVGEQWVTTMFKRRKGAELAEQTIILNKKSKEIIENIIKITSLARNYMRANNNKNYEFMLLRSSSLYTPPDRLDDIRNLNEICLYEKIKTDYICEDFYKDKMSLDEIYQLVQNFTITKFRASCGVREYIKTTSIERMSEALGHENFEPRLMLSYLPAPLWSYFTNRWIRIFQNAIIFEAMKDSKHLFEAIDLTPEQLDDFINNHGLGELPKFLEKEVSSPSEKNNYIGIFPISTPLLQWFIAIINFIENKNKTEILNKIALKWYQSALLVISYIEINLSENYKNSIHINQDVLEMYLIAKQNPLNMNVVRGTLICSN